MCLLLLPPYINMEVRADIRQICVLSDLHVMAPSLIDSQDNRAWQEDLAFKKTMQELSAPIFDAVVEQIKRRKPDLLLIAGDLTKDGERESHEYVLKKLREIKDAGIPIYVIPGNHDRGYMEQARKYANDTYTEAEQFSNDDFRAAYADYGYGNDSEYYQSSLTYATEPLQGLTLIGIDTGIWCAVSDGALAWVTEKAKEAQQKGNQVIVMMHHLLMPHYQNQSELEELAIPQNYVDIRRELMNAGIKVVLTGHTHISDIARYTDENGREIYDIATGSPISYPCDYRTLILNDATMQLMVTTTNLTQLEGYADFPRYAAGRLERSITDWATRWVKERTGSELAASLVAPEIAACFKIHAEGNEPHNPDAVKELELFEAIKKVYDGTAFPALFVTAESCVRSMLGNYPSEDDESNVVNDRTLSIKLNAAETGITAPSRQSTDSSIWYTLEGMRLAQKPTQAGIYIHNGRKVVITKNNF